MIQYHKPGAILCADRYHKKWKPWGTPVKPPPPQLRRVMAATQAGRFTIRDPSSGGPFSVATIYGITWAGDESWGITPGGPGQNFGLG
jgi:hypothetical protein